MPPPSLAAIVSVPVAPVSHSIGKGALSDIFGAPASAVPVSRSNVQTYAYSMVLPRMENAPPVIPVRREAPAAAAPAAAAAAAAPPLAARSTAMEEDIGTFSDPGPVPAPTRDRTHGSSTPPDQGSSAGLTAEGEGGSGLGLNVPKPGISRKKKRAVVGTIFGADGSTTTGESSMV